MKQAKDLAQHSSATNAWGTSRTWIDIARVVLGRIDLDPFSDAQWNAVIGARRFLDEKDDAFSCRWFDEGPEASEVLVRASIEPVQPHDVTVLANSPGDATGTKTKNAWHLLDRYHDAGYVGGGAFWIAFNIGQLQTLQSGGGRSPLHPDFLRCIPRSRVQFQRRGGSLAGERAPHASCIVLLPGSGDVGQRQRKVFRMLCEEHGAVL